MSFFYATRTSTTWLGTPGAGWRVGGLWTTVEAAGLDQRTPDLSAILQEIVDRPGWASGHGLVLIMTGSGVQQAKAFEHTPANPPLLHVEYAQ